jgi:hypothetical protein
MEHIHKKGSELDRDELDVINKWRVKEFRSDTLWGPGTLPAFGDSEMFLLKDNGTLLAFCRLRPIKITVYSRTGTNIWGLGAVVTIVRGKGYGKMLLSDVITFLDSGDKVMVGFCSPDNSGFYEKSGFSVLPDGATRFIYINGKNERIAGKPGIAFFYPRDNKILTALLTDPELSITHFVPHW